MSYDEIKAKCLMERTLFEDPDFPADNSSLYYDKEKKSPATFKWMRPKDFVQEILGESKTPEFFDTLGESRFDIQQGDLGDCWMLASMACLSMRPNLFDKVVPFAGQSFDKEDYAGIFRFRIWRFGEWVDVIIDDRLPTALYRPKDGAGRPIRRLVYATSSTQNEFWSALLQKAYAKLCGCYEAIEGGRPLDSMVDFTGGIGEYFELKPEDREKIWRIMAKAHERKSLMCCATAASPVNADFLPNGLVSGHAYSVTKVTPFNTTEFGNFQMVRVRNPWGSHDEDWRGEWSDKNIRRQWDRLSISERQVLGFKDKDDVKTDGEFWMTIDEFVASFEGGLDICHLNPEYFHNNDAAAKAKQWNAECYDGCWKDEISAGGFVDDEKFWTNPQYGFEVVDVDDDDNKDAGTVIIALMQKDRRKNGFENLIIGYALYKSDDSRSARLDRTFDFCGLINNEQPTTDAREICYRHELPEGSYCIVPYRVPTMVTNSESTKIVTTEGDFILRVFTEKRLTSRELDEPTEKMDPSRNEIKPVSENLKNCKEIWEKFQKNSKETKTFDAWDLKTILKADFVPEFKFNGFSAETCWSLVVLKQGAFMTYDKDRNGTFDSYELREAMHAIGYSVSNGTFTALVESYSRNSKIHFDDFVRGMARLSKKFEEHRESNSSFSLEEFILRNI